MPPRVKVHKQDIISAALEITRKQGSEAVNARSLATRLACSTQPIFSNFASMDELKVELIQAADKRYRAYQTREMQLERYPMYKASGMAYIRFAKEEKELFKLLFMRDRSNEVIENSEEKIEDLIYYLHENAGLSYEDASMFHLEMWIYVHGIATMMATSYLELEWNTVSNMLTDAFEGLKKRYNSKEEI